MASWGSSGGSAESGLERNAEGACPQRVGGEPWKTCLPAPGGGRERGLHGASDEDQSRSGGERRAGGSVSRAGLGREGGAEGPGKRKRAYDQGQQPESQSEPSPVLSLGFHVHHLPDVDCKMLAEVTLLVRQGPISECRQDIFSGSYLFGARQDGR